MSKLIKKLSVIAALLVASHTPAYAQPQAGSTPRADAHPTGTTLAPLWDLSAGYQVLHVPDQTFPFGLNVDGARNWGNLGLAAEVGWSLDKDNDLTAHVFNIGAGPRWTKRSKAAVWPFAQVLAGIVHNRVSIDTAGGDISDNATKFMVQPGAGVIILAGDGWGVIGQADYRRVFLDKDKDGESGQNQVRVFVGVRFILD